MTETGSRPKKVYRPPLPLSSTQAYGPASSQARDQSAGKPEAASGHLTANGSTVQVPVCAQSLHCSHVVIFSITRADPPNLHPEEALFLLEASILEDRLKIKAPEPFGWNGWGLQRPLGATIYASKLYSGVLR
ncbi:hypothetical protein D3C76_1295760 [compost metagenome]